MSQEVGNVASSANLFGPASGRVCHVCSFMHGSKWHGNTELNFHKTSANIGGAIPKYEFVMQELASKLTQKLGGKAPAQLGRTQSTLAVGLQSMSMSFDAFGRAPAHESCVLFYAMS